MLTLMECTLYHNFENREEKRRKKGVKQRNKEAPACLVFANVSPSFLGARDLGLRPQLVYVRPEHGGGRVGLPTGEQRDRAAWRVRQRSRGQLRDGGVPCAWVTRAGPTESQD